MHWQLSEAAGKIWKDLLTPLCVVVQLIFDIVWHTKISCVMVYTMMWYRNIMACTL